jgi:signal transduction histidine kinase
MLTGQPPFAGKSHTVMQYMHLHGQRPRPSSLTNVNPAIDEVILQAMAPERQARYSDPKVFVAAFRDAIGTSGAQKRVRSRRAEHTACRALAVYVDVRIGSESVDDAQDEVLLDETDAVLSAAEQHLTKRNFHIGLEGSSSTLYVRALSPASDTERRERREAALTVYELHRTLEARLRAHPSIHVNLCIHSDYALMRDGQIRGGDLMRLERWAPDADIQGVVGSPEVFADLGLETGEVTEHRQLVRLLRRPDSATSAWGAGTEHLMHTQMLAHLGRQLAEIAHDLRSPLTVVMGNVDLVLQRAKRGVPLDDDEQHALSDALTAAQQLKDIVANLLGASAIKTYGKDRRKLSVNALVKNALMLARGETRRKAEVRIVHDGESHVMGSPGRLTQVLVNLIINAAQAIPEYGEIIIRTGTAADGAVQIIIRDNGVGMSSEVQERIFEPFFTTKEIQSGTGLGLALVRQIIEEHEGTITVSSEPGSGSCFTISLPAA